MSGRAVARSPLPLSGKAGAVNELAIDALGRYGIFLSVSHLTKQEQIALCVILGLLLTGWAVKAYRTAHPPVQAAEISEP